MSWIEEAARAEFSRLPIYTTSESARQAALARRARMSEGARPDPGIMSPSAFEQIQKEERHRQQEERGRRRAIEIDWETLTIPPEPPIAERPKAMMKVIKKTVADHYGIAQPYLLFGGRRSEAVFPRQVAMYLCKTIAMQSLPEIGRAFAGRDHTTVLHALRRVERKIATDRQLARDVESIRQKVEAWTGPQVRPALDGLGEIKVDLLSNTVTSPAGKIIVPHVTAELTYALLPTVKPNTVVTAKSLITAVWGAGAGPERMFAFHVHLHRMRHGYRGRQGGHGGPRRHHPGLRSLGLDVEYVEGRGYRLVEMSP